MKDSNYIVVTGWMVNRLELKGVDLLIYAIIYGFSQDGESCYKGSLTYLADLVKLDKSNVRKHLQAMVERGVLNRYEHISNGVTFADYSANVPSEITRGTSDLPVGGTSDLPVGGTGKTPPHNTSIDNTRIDKPRIITPVVPTGFNEFWKAYPKKVGKSAALLAYTKLRLTDEQIDSLLVGLEAYKRSDQWQRDGGRYILNPSTFLNQRRWEDELQPEPERASPDNWF